MVAARLAELGSEWRVFRAIQLANFTTPLVLDDDEQLRDVLSEVPGVDADAIVAVLDSPEVTEAYDRDRAEARTAAGSPAELQGKTATTDGPVRFTAPSVVFEHGPRGSSPGVFSLWRPTTSSSPIWTRRWSAGRPPETPEPLLDAFPDGLTTQEVAALMTHGNDAPDRAAAERALVGLVAEGGAVRRALGDDALWRRP